MARKPGKGRQKIVLKEIEDRKRRDVCFSKRKEGLFKKASGLTTRCSVPLVVLVYSPAGRPYSFCSPTVDVVVDRFLGYDTAHINDDRDIQRRAMAVKQLNCRLMELNEKLELDKAKVAKLNKRLKSIMDGRRNLWPDGGLDGLGLEQLEKLESLLRGLKFTAESKAQELFCSTSDDASTSNPNLAGESTANPFGSPKVMGYDSHDFTF